MAQTPEDEWFAPDEADSPTDTPRRPAEDDWLTAGASPARAAGLDLSSLNTAQGMAAAGVVVVGVVALVAVVVALAGSGPSGAQGVPVVAAPIAATHTSPNTSTSASPAPTVAAPTTTLKPGDTGPQVKALQRELKGLGYSVGTIDGSYGTQTSKAVMAFQRARHLTADGIVGPQTLAALAP